MPFAPSANRASVALVLAGVDEALQLALIRRAEFDGDPWSGHMALPGGRALPTDRDARAVAERETEEEIGLRLVGDHYLGGLSDLPIMRLGVDTGMILSPFVYYIGSETPAFTPSGEVAEAQWIALEHLWSRRNHTTLEIQRQGRPATFRAIALGDHLVWGLTFRVLSLLGGVIGHPL